jgi:drug/metabolite transporter (DMT)-like permease
MSRIGGKIRMDCDSPLCESGGMKTSHLLQLLLLSAVWGASFLLIRIAGDSFPPLWVALLRCSAGALLLWAVKLAGRRSLPPRELFPWLLLVALFNNAIPFTFFAWGERSIPSSTAAVVNATTPIWTLLISLLVQRGHVTGRMIVGVLISFAGVVLVVSGQRNADSSLAASRGFAFGVTLVVLASLCYAIAAVAAKARLKGIDPIGLATTQLTLSSLMLLPAALAGAQPAGVRVPAIAAIATLGLAGSGIAYLLYYNLLAHVSATHVVAVTYLTPKWGLFWGLLAHEPIGWTAYAGVAVVIGGVLLLNWNPKSAAIPAVPFRGAEATIRGDQ